jgi:hypothetical protein
LGTSILAAGGAVGKLAGQAGLLGLAGAVGVAVGSMARLIPGVDEAVQGFAKWTDEIFNWTGNQKSVDTGLGELGSNLDQLTRILQGSSTEFQTATDKTKEFDDMLKLVQSTPTDIKIAAKTDDKSFIAAQKTIEKTIEGDQVVIVQTKPDLVSLDKTKAKIEESVPELKRLEIQAEIDVASIKAQADVIQKAIEWRAQIDIAEIEAGARKIEAIMESVGQSTQGAADVLSSIFGNLEGGHISFEMERIIDRQIDIQEEALEIQKELTEAQIDLINAKKEQISKGTALITVEAAGLTPALEMIWQQVIEYSQVRATEEGLDLLL